MLRSGRIASLPPLAFFPYFRKGDLGEEYYSKKHRLLGAVLALCMALTMLAPCTGMLATAFAVDGLTGEGTPESPFLIGTAQELTAFAGLVNGGQKTLCAELTEDIYLNDETFTFDKDTGLVKVTDGTNTAYIGTGIKGNKSGSNATFDARASIRGYWYASDTSTTSSETSIYTGTLDVSVQIKMLPIILKEFLTVKTILFTACTILNCQAESADCFTFCMVMQ